MKSRALFGEEDWDCEDWVGVDDSVRGGKSVSHLDCGEHSARFYGTLDLSNLDGAAGFASQQTKNDLDLDLSKYVGIQLDIKKGDKKRYTLICKNEIPPSKSDDGGEKSTISYEVDFILQPESEPDDACEQTVFFPWDAFNATYRGRLKKDAPPLDTDCIRRISIMVRSFFGAQDGDFSLEIKSIAALTETPQPGKQSSTVPAKAFQNAGRLENAKWMERDPDMRTCSLRFWPLRLVCTCGVHRQAFLVLLTFATCLGLGFCYRMWLGTMQVPGGLNR